MADWVDGLDDEQREAWDSFVAHVRRDTVEKMLSSAFVMSIVPDKPDVKFAVELGLSIMMDKPIIAVVLPGVEVPKKLLLVADYVVEADIDTEQGRRVMAEAIDRIVSER